MKTRFVGLGLATLLLAGCGAGDACLLLPPAVAQTQPPQAPSLEGDWIGQVDPDTRLSLTIEQDGSNLHGSGYLFKNDDPVPVTLAGSMEDNNYLIDLHSENPDITQDLLLQGQLIGPHAVGFLGSESQLDDRPLTLSKDEAIQGRLHDNSPAGLPQTFTVDLSHPSGNVRAFLTLEDTFHDGKGLAFEGRWISEQPIGPKYMADQPVQSGFLQGQSISGDTNWCKFELFDHPSMPSSDVATLVFRRPQGVGSRFTVPLDADSTFIYRAEGGSGGRTTKRHYCGGSVSP